MLRQTVKVSLFIIGIFAFIALILTNFYKNSSNIKTGVVINETSAEHNRQGHPESSNRLEAIVNNLKKKSFFSKVKIIKERKASKEELYLAHDKVYVDSVLLNKSNASFFTNDKWSPYNSTGSINAALTSVGSLVELSEMVAKGELSNGFAIIRPPGHHATKNQAMGFCLFNNIAVAAQNIFSKNLAKKILIVDTDAHFGNGIADIFSNDSRVYYISINQKWMYPYSQGKSTELIKDLKIDFLFDENEHLKLFKESVSLAIEDFKPDFIFVSAGYDAHWRDYMSNLSLSLTSYAEMSKFLVDVSKKTANGRIVFSLEGGYDLEVLALAVTNSISALLGENIFEDPIGKKSINK